MLSTIVVAVALAVGAFVLLQLYERQLVDNLDGTLEQQVTDRVRLLDAGGTNELLTTVLQGEAFVWIGTPDGEVVAQGGGIFPLENPVPKTIGQTSTVRLLVEERKPDEVETEVMELRLASGEAASGNVVLAGSELEVIDETLADLARLFLISAPLVSLLVGWLTWIVSGRALRPVAAIRSQAEYISGTTLSERVPVPGTHDEVDDLARTMNEMLDRIERHDVAIRQFSSDASHELKSPIANIKAMIETRSSTDPSWGGVQDRLSREAERLGELVDNLLYLSTHRDRPSGEPSSVALDELLFAEAELVAATTDLKVDLAGVTPLSVAGSPSDLQRLIRNLVDNASRHGEERIAFALSTSDAGTTLSVSDDGSGVPDDAKEAVFERFTRLDEARDRDAGGSGLGLSIVAQVAAAHDGEVSVHDSALGGAEFRVVFRS